MAINPPLVDVPNWALCLDMAHGDPLRAKEIHKKLDRVWFERWRVWKSERAKVGVPDSVVAMYATK